VPGQVLLIGLLGHHRLPGGAEVVDEADERLHQRLVEQAGLGPEIAEQQVLGDPGRLGDLLGGGAAVILAGEQLSRSVQQQSTGFAAGPPGGRRSRRRGTLWHVCCSSNR